MILPTGWAGSERRGAVRAAPGGTGPCPGAAPAGRDPVGSGGLEPVVVVLAPVLPGVALPRPPGEERALRLGDVAGGGEGRGDAQGVVGLEGFRRAREEGVEVHGRRSGAGTRRHSGP